MTPIFRPASHLTHAGTRPVVFHVPPTPTRGPRPKVSKGPETPPVRANCTHADVLHWLRLPTDAPLMADDHATKVAAVAIHLDLTAGIGVRLTGKTAAGELREWSAWQVSDAGPDHPPERMLTLDASPILRLPGTLVALCRPGSRFLGPALLRLAGVEPGICEVYGEEGDTLPTSLTLAVAVSVGRAIQSRLFPWAGLSALIAACGAPADGRDGGVGSAWDGMVDKLEIGYPTIDAIMAGERPTIVCDADADADEDEDAERVVGRWDWDADRLRLTDGTLRSAIAARVAASEMSPYSLAKAASAGGPEAEWNPSVAHVRRYLAGESDMTGERLDRVLRALGMEVR